MAKVTRSFKLDTEQDADVLAWLDGQANASEAIRNACRQAAQGNGATLDEVLRAVEALGREIKTARYTQQSWAQAEHALQEDRGDAAGTEAAAGNLEALGRW